LVTLIVVCCAETEVITHLMAKVGQTRIRAKVRNNLAMATRCLNYADRREKSSFNRSITCLQAAQCELLGYPQVKPEHASGVPQTYSTPSSSG
jgi:hypothetical protein